MLKKILFTTIVSLTVQIATAQKGYFGKKTVISVEGVLKGNVIYNWFLDNYDYMNGTSHTSSRNRLIGGGLNASISHYFSNSAGVGVDFHLVYNYIKTPIISEQDSYNPNSGYDGIKTITLQELRMRTFYVVPKFEWSSGGNLPVGLVHSVGIGYAGSFIIDDRYKSYQTNFDYSTSTVTSGPQMIQGSRFAPVHGLAIEYGAKLRFPITSFMAFNIGSTLRVHLPLTFDISQFGEAPYGLDEEVRKSMRTSRASYLMDIRAGLSFILF